MDKFETENKPCREREDFSDIETNQTERNLTNQPILSS